MENHQLHVVFVLCIYFRLVCQDTSVKQNLIRTLDLIGDALHPDHLKTTYNFSNRGEFITHLQVYTGPFFPNSLFQNLKDYG